MCYVRGKRIESVEFYLSITPCPHFVAGFSLVLFKRPEAHGSVSSVPFSVPQKLFHPFHAFTMLLNMKRGTPLKRKVCSQIRAGFGDLLKLCGLWFCFTRAGSPGQVLATFLSLLAAGVCPPFNIRTAAPVPLVDLGEELKQSPVPTGWGDLAFMHSIEMQFCSHLLWTTACQAIGMDRWGRRFQRTGEIRVGVCCPSQWTCGGKDFTHFVAIMNTNVVCDSWGALGHSTASMQVLMIRCFSETLCESRKGM